MAVLIWTEPAVADLDAIADYIALDNPEAARALVARVFTHVEQLASHPESGSRPRELGSRSRYRRSWSRPAGCFTATRRQPNAFSFPTSCVGKPCCVAVGSRNLNGLFVTPSRSASSGCTGK